MMSLIFGMIMRYSHTVYHQEVQQKFYVGIAGRFAALAGWTSSGWLDSDAFVRLTKANLQYHIFILDAEGRVLSHYPESATLSSRRISMQPIQRFLQPKPSFPILGDDPTEQHEQQIFSVTRLESENRPEQYLYVIVHSEEHDEFAKGLRLSYVTREGAWLVVASLLLALGGGLLSLHFIVRPLKQLASIMDDFRGNHFNGDLASTRKPVSSGDEIEVLTATFYRMAGQMQAQMRKLEQADAHRREFIANVSHDLRTPLASIQGYLDTLLLKEERMSQQERQQYLQIAVRQAKSLSQLISALFYLAKLDSDQAALQLEPFRIEEVVQDVVQKFALQASSKNIRLVMQGHDRLPFVCADLGLVERALSNLIDNALRHTPQDGTVQIQLQLVNEKVWVSVADSGPGITEPDLSHIFERFYRGNRAHEDSSASAGLGLAIVRRILELHGEVAEAANMPAGGAQFRFSLPVKEASSHTSHRAGWTV
ncbi:MAG TPA: sensor histidine kinase [Oxalobacteraceae bacterium]|nr:sensor histidine kinase [Oxalobacteraceae bacterium]